MPAGATYVMYTEKELMYYVPGLANLISGTGQCNGTFTTSTGGCTISYTVQPYASQSLPSTSSSVTVTYGCHVYRVDDHQLLLRGEHLLRELRHRCDGQQRRHVPDGDLFRWRQRDDRRLERLQHSVLWDVGHLDLCRVLDLRRGSGREPLVPDPSLELTGEGQHVHIEGGREALREQ